MTDEAVRPARTSGQATLEHQPPPSPLRNPTDLARSLYEHYQARDWSAAEQVFHPDVELRMPATSEVLTGRDSVLGLQVNYPEPWGELRVLQVVGGGSSSAAVEVEIIGPEQVFRCAAFWEVHEDRLYRGTEYWVTVGADDPGPR